MRRETCAEVAESWEVGPHVILGAGEARAGGRKKAAILGDVCEALIGAVFLDGGFAAARAVVRRHWQARMLADAAPIQDAKTAVQEWAQARGLATPELSRDRTQRPRASAAVRHAGGAGRLRPRAGRGVVEARGGTGRGAGVSRAMGEPMTACGFVALIGAPNAGKSTLINKLVGAKVAIVSRKAQTTRGPVRGVVIEGEAQIVFVDTAGLFAPKRRLDRAMTDAAWSAAADADISALIVDARAEATETSDKLAHVLDGLRTRKGRRVLILNKIDLVERRLLLALAERINQALPFDETFMVSAETGSGLDRLKRDLARAMPAGPWLYPEDQIADAPMRALAAEITREKIFERLHEELPYQMTVETESWKDLPDGSARIEQTIYVTRDAHKKIVIGEGGRTLKAIGSAARKEIAEANESKVHLFLFVKVRENWLDDPERYRAMGLEFPKK